MANVGFPRGALLPLGPSERRRTLSVLMLPLAALLAALALSSGRMAVMGGVALVGLAAAPTLARLRSEPLDAPGLYAAATFLTFGVTGLAWLGTPEGPGPGLDQAEVGRALAVVALGIAAFGGGARLAGPDRPSSRPAVGATPRLGVLATAYAVALVAIGAGFVLGTYGYVADVGAGQSAGAWTSFVAATGSVTILAVALAWLTSRERRFGVLLVALLLVQVPIGFVAGVKGESLIAPVLVGLAYVLYRRRIPWKAAATGVAVTFFVLVPANEAYRISLRSPGGASAGTIAHLLTDPGLYRPDRSVDNAVAYGFTRFRHIDHVALVVRYTPEEFAFGDGSHYYLLPLFVFVPRAVWSDKPVLDVAAQFSRTYWQIPPSIRTSQPVTQVGDLFRNFGLLGVAAGLFVWGILLSLWTRFWRMRRSPRLDLVYLYAMVVGVLYVESDLPFIIATTARSLPLAAVLGWLLLPGRAGEPGYVTLRRRLRLRQENLPA